MKLFRLGVPYGSGPASVEAALRLRSWGSQRDLANENKTAAALSHSSSEDPEAPVCGAEARAAASSAHDPGPMLELSAPEEVDVLSIEADDCEQDSPVHGHAYEELIEVVTRAVVRLNISWPHDEQGMQVKSKLDERFLQHRGLGDLPALAVTPACLEFAPGGVKAILHPRPGYVPKVPSNMAQSAVLQAFHPPPHVSAEEERLHLLCPSFQSLSALPESTDVNDNPFSSLFSFVGVRESVRQLRDKLEDFCKEKKISDRVTFSNIVPRTRNDFLQYSHQLNLDLNTVNKLLCLSERNRVITDSFTFRQLLKLQLGFQSYPDHPDRFDHYAQVLCRESVCGLCYWEIEWSGRCVCISVSYKSISRKGRGKECEFGCNDQSWSLICSPSSYSFRHNNIETKLPVKPISSRTGVCVDYSRIGVYVDHSAGTLSFYSVSDTMSLIHTVQTTFTQPLYPGFMVYNIGSSVKLC
ncbi:E3 ubiquitin-protein ligase TRIM65-like [Siphateles boraxobius]|uniref:E3 ubiquitin-protein ligase TRIM65-like n=1 Tax=Siphateles boraxobius TaxID=180520 RepID=UPI004063050C